MASKQLPAHQSPTFATISHHMRWLDANVSRPTRRIFENGIQIGRTEMYYPDGKLKEVQYYQNGKKEGGDTIFYANGQPQFLVTFKQGKMDGPMRRWQENGDLFFEAFYQQDSLKQVTKKLGVDVK